MPKIKLTQQQQLQLQECLSGYLVSLHASGQPVGSRFSQTSQLLSKVRNRHPGAELQLNDAEIEVLNASGCEGRCALLKQAQKIAN